MRTSVSVPQQSSNLGTRFHRRVDIGPPLGGGRPFGAAGTSSWFGDVLPNTLPAGYTTQLYTFACTVLVPHGKLDAASLQAAYQADTKQRLQIQLRRRARGGQPDQLNQIPLYAHVRVS